MGCSNFKGQVFPISIYNGPVTYERAVDKFKSRQADFVQSVPEHLNLNIVLAQCFKFKINFNFILTNKLINYLPTILT